MRYMNRPIRVIALKNKDINSLKRSTSGGAFVIFADAVLKSGGVVFGSKLFDDGFARHMSVSHKDQLSELQGTKYVQSLTGDTYRECLTYLSKDIRVFYTGTPCQIYGLRQYLDRQHVADSIFNNLLCADIVCHGTPKPELFHLHQEWLISKLGAEGPIKNYEFRSKLVEWGKYYYHFNYTKDGHNKEVLGPAIEDPYYKAFIECGIFRKGCYKCPFARAERVGDVTLGDYWGIEREHPSFVTKDGCSLLLINTNKGKSFFEEKCMTSCDYINSSFEQAARHNINLLRPSSLPSGYEVLRPSIDEAVQQGDYLRLYDDILKVPLSAKQLVRRKIPVSMYLRLRAFKHRGS